MIQWVKDAIQTNGMIFILTKKESMEELTNKS